jgi:hypothetical protein
MDFSASQQLASRIAGRQHGLELRANVLNFATRLNSDFGTATRSSPRSGCFCERSYE